MDGCAHPGFFLPLQQSAVYADAVRGCGARVRWLDLGCGRALAVERGPVRLVSRGPVWDAVWEAGASTHDRLMALRRVARWPGVTLATPDAPVAGRGLVPLVTPMHHAIWTLTPDLRAGMAANWRNQLAAGRRAGVCIEPGGRTTLDHLVTAEAAQRLTRRYRALPGAFTRALPDGALRLWHWRHDGQTAAAMAFIRHGNSATYHLAWGSDAARREGVHKVMLTRAAEGLFAEGVRWLDLGPVNTEAAPGLARFKLGTGATLNRLGPTVLVLP